MSARGCVVRSLFMSPQLTFYAFYVLYSFCYLYVAHSNLQHRVLSFITEGMSPTILSQLKEDATTKTYGHSEYVFYVTIHHTSYHHK